MVDGGLDGVVDGTVVDEGALDDEVRDSLSNLLTTPSRPDTTDNSPDTASSLGFRSGAPALYSALKSSKLCRSLSTLVEHEFSFNFFSTAADFLLCPSMALASCARFRLFISIP